MPFTDWKVYIKANVEVLPEVFGVYETSNSTADSSQITFIGCGEIREELRRQLRDSCVGSSTISDMNRHSLIRWLKREKGPCCRSSEKSMAVCQSVMNIEVEPVPYVVRLRGAGLEFER